MNLCTVRLPARSGRVALVLAAAFCLGPAVHAGAVKTWAPSSMEDFAPGTMQETALDEQGHVRLAPAFQTLWGPEPGVVWAVAPVARGAFVALSGPARVLRVEAGREVESWYESTDDVLVTAVASAGKQGVYLGVSPRGAVIHASGPAERRTLLETGATFVWALKRGPDGTLWVATGAPGRLLRYGGKGEPETVYESADDPIRCLALQPDGRIVAGTAARGRVIRIGTDDRPFVLLDSEEDEIVSIAATADGTVYALAARGTRKESAEPQVDETVRVTAEAPEDKDEDARPERASRQPLPAPTRAGGALYRLDPDGSVWRIWHSTAETPYAVIAREDGKLIVATGSSGKIFELDRRGEGAGLLRYPSDEVSALALGADGRVWVGGAADARVAVLGPGSAKAGSYVSSPLDAGGVAAWGAIRWEANVPRGATLELHVRSGNTATPDDTWSGWAKPRATDPARGATAPAPPARWFQVRVTMTPSRDGSSPVLRRIELSYLPHNRPPQIESLTLEPVGIAWSKGPTQTQARGAPVVADDPVARKASRNLVRSRAAPIRKSYEPGARTFSWAARDIDGDALSFGLEIRREGASHWFPLARRIEEKFHSWDSRAMPDGLYRVRLTADDAPDNPHGKNLTTRRVSKPFRVDNTPPSVTGFEVRSRAGDYEVSFVARDPNGRIEAVEYALGDGWKRLDPLDGVADSEEEHYRLEIEGSSADESAPRHVVVRVTDTAGNLGGDMRALDGSAGKRP